MSIYYDPDYPKKSEIRFCSYNWEDFYAGFKEHAPHYMPEPLGRASEINVFLHVIHTTDKMTRRSQTGTLIFVNRAPIIF